MGRNHQGLAGWYIANLLGSPTRDKCTVTTVMLLWLYSPNPPCTRNFQIYTAWQSFLLWGSLHSLEKPESYRSCHSLNPYRHRALCTRGLLLLCIGQTTRGKYTVIPVILLWLYSPKPPCTRNFQIYTAWQSFLLWSPSQLAEARILPGKP